MKIPFYILLLILVSSCENSNNIDPNFSPYPKVQNAYAEKINTLNQLLAKKNIEPHSLHIFLRAFKLSKKLELWAKNANDKQYQLLQTYPICYRPGELGPKRQEGDSQVPEGFYHIEIFNPTSLFELSLGINYPNKSDTILGKKEALGYDIYLHGGCASSGCIPITNDKIKEVYTLAEWAKRAKQEKIPVHIFPFHLTYEKITDSNAEFQSFWQNLKGGYDYFEKNHTIPHINIDSQGKYIW